MMRMSKRIAIGIMLVSLVVVIGAAHDDDGPRAITVYEDGSGTLPDGRVFCLKGGLCND